MASKPKSKSTSKSTSKPGRSKKDQAPQGEATTQKASSQAAKAGRAAAKQPDAGGSRGSVRVYRQGLGDCILIRVKRKGKDDFKLLIDCGVVLGTPNPAVPMTRIVENIVAETGKFVDVLAITHEHWDHLSGFIQAGDTFKSLKAGEVWVAWTEDDDDPLAKELKSELGKAEKALAASATALREINDDEAAEMLHDLAATTFGMGAAAANSTKAAFDIAKRMADPKPPRLCRPTDAAFEIPGADARIYVLGPPHDEKLIRKINPSKSALETYALAMDGRGVLSFGVAAALGLEKSLDKGAPFHRRVSIPLEVGKEHDFFKKNYYDEDDWRRIDGDWLGSAPSLALALQSYTNNTSLVLAIELGEVGSGDVLLFAGDAQVGNWESWQLLKWPETDPKVTGPSLLKRAVFYKVGHHGSHNATLKQHGLDMMASLKAAVIPVDEVMAGKKHWGHMPLEAIVTTLTQKVPEGYFLRTDKDPPKPGKGVVVDRDFFEVPF